MNWVDIKTNSPPKYKTVWLRDKYDIYFSGCFVEEYDGHMFFESTDGRYCSFITHWAEIERVVN